MLPLLPLFTAATFHRGPMPGEPPDARFVEAGGARVRYLDVGDGPAVVLLHGFASSLDAWAAAIPHLSSAHRVVALDLKGFGWTDRPPGDYSPTAQARLVLSVMDALGVQDAAVAAHSWGCSVALAMTHQAPWRVRRLALYSAWVYEEQLPPVFRWSRAPGVGETIFGLYYGERARERLALAFHDPRHVSEDLVREVERALRRPGTRAAALAAVRGQRFSQVQHQYRGVRVPTLLLWGREDRVTPLSIGQRLMADLPQAKLLAYSGCGHFPMIEAARPSTADLALFLREG